MNWDTVQSISQTIGERTEIDQILSPILLALYVTGHQVLDPNWSWRKNALRHLCCLLLLVYVAAGTINFMQNTDDIKLSSEAFFTLVITCQFPIQITVFSYYRSTFREVYAMAKTSLFNIIMEISPVRGAYVTALLRKMVKALFIFIITAILNFLLTALYFYLFGTRVTLSRTTSTLMPMTSPTYELGLLIHLIYLWMVSFGILVVDTWFIYLTYFFCEASDCAVKILQVQKLDENIYSSQLNEALRKFYYVHLILMQYLNKLNIMYKWPLLIPMFVVLVNTCVFLLVWTEEPNLQLAIIVLITSVEISAYNLLGEKIKSKAQDMYMTLLNFDWMHMRLKDRKNYYIIICYMNKDFGIRTAVGLDLSLVTLSSIYKGSYQAFAVLNTIKN